MSANYLETGSVDPYYNLAFEEYILENKLCGDWLMLWQNANTVVVGLNQNTAQEIDPAFVSAHGITVVRRRTGGGAVYHDLGNLNYSFITELKDAASLSIDRYTLPICRALESMGVRAETTGRNDITVNGRKVSGVAQRIYKNRILHHGTVLFDSDLEMIAGALRADSAKFLSKGSSSVRSRVGNIRQLLPTDMTLEEFKRRLLKELTADGLQRRELESDELKEVERIAHRRYESWQWNYGRSPEYDYINKARFTGGSIEVRLRVKNGEIASVCFPGDYMALADNEPICRTLEGLPCRRAEIDKALRGFDLPTFFGAVTREELLELLMGALS